MEKPNSYCDYVNRLPDGNLHRVYHDTQYGFPLDADNELFGRLVLEINQAGLSWTTILTKQDNFRKAYANFGIKAVAGFGDTDVKKLLGNTGIVRNTLKIKAAIYNANKIMALQQSHGSFKNWLDQNHPLSLEQWVRLFKKTFTFTGGEITKEFLMSTGYLPGAHIETCKVFKTVIKQQPRWHTCRTTTQ
jgi:DNA-3-methyladenine glycosylase I